MVRALGRNDRPGSSGFPNSLGYSSLYSYGELYLHNQKITPPLTFVSVMLTRSRPREHTQFCILKLMFPRGA